MQYCLELPDIIKTARTNIEHGELQTTGDQSQDHKADISYKIYDLPQLDCSSLQVE